MVMNQTINGQTNIEKLNKDIEQFPEVSPITPDMHIARTGVSRMVMLDRYAFKDTEQKTIRVGDVVVLTVKEDPTYPARGIGHIQEIDKANNSVTVLVEEEFRGAIVDERGRELGLVTTELNKVEKPLELFFEQITQRVARGLSAVESNEFERKKLYDEFYKQLVTEQYVPAGRVLYGAGSGKEVTYFNCYVMPFVPDSRGGISEHRTQVMEIMSRGGGVGTNGSTLRPNRALARGVNGKSSGAVSWLDDIAKLTHLVEQGGSRRGAQMIMLSDWHPDILEFIISKMQNPRILRYLIENSQDEQLIQLAKDKLKFTPFSAKEMEMYQGIVKQGEVEGQTLFSKDLVKDAQTKVRAGGTYGVHNVDFLTGANISVTLTDDFMKAVEEDGMWDLKYPDVENYDEDEMRVYNTEWQEIGDVREWEALGHGIKTYRTIRARELWDLINICATYAAEPGVFFIDNANADTNATAYGQKVVATNPCGEQPLAPYSVCNLAAVNLSEMANKDEMTVDYAKLTETVKTGIRMQDNVIDATPYFLKPNELQALGERRIGLGVMGLADLMIYTGNRYGSPEGNKIVDKVFKTIAVAAYEQSIELAKTRGSFPFLVGKTEDETAELRKRFINTGFMKRMPEHIREGVLAHGIRNSHLLTVAPTGSTGTMVNVSTGLEPYFAFKYFRSGRLGKFIEVNADIVQEYIDRNPGADTDNLPDYFVSSMELSPEEHVDVQTTIQRWVDSSISKTVNAPRDYTPEQVQAVYERLYAGGAKGGTVYVDGSRDSQVLSLKAEENDLDDVDTVSETNTPAQASVRSDSDAPEQPVQYGTNAGDTCPECRVGIVEDIAGCSTCSNCGIQLQCGL